MTESTDSTTARNTDENGDVLSADWFDALIKAEFLHAGFTPVSQKGNAWTVGRTAEEVSWYVNKHIHVSHRDSGRVFLMMVGVAINAGPWYLRVPTDINDPQVFLFSINFNALEFSPGIELGIPPENASLLSEHSFGSDLYWGYGDTIMDLDSEVSLGERCRTIRELALRIGTVASQVTTLDALRNFIKSFHMNPYTEDADPWFSPSGKYYRQSFAEMRNRNWQ